MATVQEYAQLTNKSKGQGTTGMKILTRKGKHLNLKISQEKLF